jgi:hypothetical protein
MFLWTSDHQQAFLPPKQALSVAPVLALPDFSKQFQLETDASEVGVRVVLMQQGHSLARHWVLELEASLHMKKKYLSILISMDHWRAYMQLVEFIIFTGQKSLTHLSD